MYKYLDNYEKKSIKNILNNFSLFYDIKNLLEDKKEELLSLKTTDDMMIFIEDNSLNSVDLMFLDEIKKRVSYSYEEKIINSIYSGLKLSEVCRYLDGNLETDHSLFWNMYNEACIKYIIDKEGYSKKLIDTIYEFVNCEDNDPEYSFIQLLKKISTNYNVECKEFSFRDVIMDYENLRGVDLIDRSLPCLVDRVVDSMNDSVEEKEDLLGKIYTESIDSLTINEREKVVEEGEYLNICYIFINKPIQNTNIFANIIESISDNYSKEDSMFDFYSNNEQTVFLIVEDVFNPSKKAHIVMAILSIFLEGWAKND